MKMGTGTKSNLSKGLSKKWESVLPHFLGISRNKGIQFHSKRKTR